MKLKLTCITVLVLALSLCAAAQTKTTSSIPTVTLSGDPANPLITNHSGKQVIAALVVMNFADKTSAATERLFTNKANQLPDGGSELIGEYSRKMPHSFVLSASLNAVIFNDGEFRGVDSHSFRMNMEEKFQAMRQVWDMANHGDWAGVQARAKGPVSTDSFGVAVATRLLEGYKNHGEAVNALKHLGLLPTTTWQSGLINKLWSIPNLFQALAEWVMPTAHAQSPITNPAPYPQSSSTDAYHPTYYTYICGFDDSNPCPELGTPSPYEGISGICNFGYPNQYYIAVQLALTSDDTNYPGARMTTGASVKPGGNTLENGGYCRNQPFLTIYESWEYDAACTGDPVRPTKINDNTGTECGVAPNGYF